MQRALSIFSVIHNSYCLIDYSGQKAQKSTRFCVKLSHSLAQGYLNLIYLYLIGLLPQSLSFLLIVAHLLTFRRYNRAACLHILISDAFEIVCRTTAYVKPETIINIRLLQNI